VNNIIRVLLIEDSSEYANLVQEFLTNPHRQKFFFGIEHVNRLEAALARLNAGEEFDVVLSDLDLPDSRGIETVSKLVEAESHADTSLPLVVLTGCDDKDIERECKRDGVQGYLNKEQVVGQLLANTLIYAIIWQRAQE
jgi:CheY-like chemotaxis protein